MSKQKRGNYHFLKPCSPSQVLKINKGIYNLEIRQNPQQARISSLSDRSERKVIEPAVIIELDIQDQEPSDKKNSDSSHFHYNPFLFAYCTLVDAETKQDILYVDGDNSRVLSGSIASCIYHLKDPEKDNNFGAFFVFPDISVKKEGKFCLKITLFKIYGSAEDPTVAQSKVVQKKSVITEPFTVYSVRAVLDPIPNSLLSKSFADQGLKLRLRKSGPTRTNDEDSNSESESESSAHSRQKPTSSRSKSKTVEKKSATIVKKEESYPPGYQPGYRPMYYRYGPPPPPPGMHPMGMPPGMPPMPGPPVPGAPGHGPPPPGMHPNGLPPPPPGYWPPYYYPMGPPPGYGRPPPMYDYHQGYYPPPPGQGPPPAQRSADRKRHLPTPYMPHPASSAPPQLPTVPRQKDSNESSEDDADDRAKRPKHSDSPRDYYYPPPMNYGYYYPRRPPPRPFPRPELPPTQNLAKPAVNDEAKPEGTGKYVPAGPAYKSDYEEDYSYKGSAPDVWPQ